MGMELMIGDAGSETVPRCRYDAYGSIGAICMINL